MLETHFIFGMHHFGPFSVDIVLNEYDSQCFTFFVLACNSTEANFELCELALISKVLKRNTRQYLYTITSCNQPSMLNCLHSAIISLDQLRSFSFLTS